MWATIIVAIIGSSGMATITAWAVNRLDRKDRTLTRDDLDKALQEAPIIREILGKLENDYRRFNEIELNQLRSELFAHTRSRTQHERQLEAGREYIDRGGNGLGHARFDWLTRDYEERLADDDWNYTVSHHHND